MYEENKFTTGELFIGFSILLVIIMIVVAPFSAFARVPVGHVGIATRFGTIVGETRSEGWHFKLPFISGNKNIEVRVQKKETTATAASKDLQSVSSVIAINYSIDKSKVIELYRSVGEEFDNRIISPAVQESVKSVTARFTAEELITKRAEVSDSILLELKEKIEKHGLLVEDLNIIDFDFSESFNQAIEAKVTAEQNALASKNKLEQIKYEAQQAVESAKGKAEAQRIEGEALRANPEVLEIRAIERWNGVLPAYMTSGANMPFIKIN